MDILATEREEVILPLGMSLQLESSVDLVELLGGDLVEAIDLPAGPLGGDLVEAVEILREDGYGVVLLESLREDG